MSEYTNGTGGAGTIVRGRFVPDYPSITLPSGYTATCRRLAAGIAANCNAQAYKELEPERPAVPTQRVEVAPDEWREMPNPGDPDYADALKAWEDRVKHAGAMKLLKIIQTYALLTPTDAEAVAAYREAIGAVGLPMPDDDRELFVWSILAPTTEDHQALLTFVLGISEAQQEAIQAQKRAFRGDVPRAQPGTVEGTEGA